MKITFNYPVAALALFIRFVLIVSSYTASRYQTPLPYKGFGAEPFECKSSESKNDKKCKQKSKCL